jgi:hypothetical protein
MMKTHCAANITKAAIWGRCKPKKVMFAQYHF